MTATPPSGPSASSDPAPWPTMAEVSVNCTTVYRHLPPLERAAAAAAAGFGAVEFWWPFDGPQPASDEVAAFLAAVRTAGVRLDAMNLYAGDMPAGERGVLCLADRREELLASAVTARAVAAETGCAKFNVLYGIPASPADDHLATAVGALAEVAAVFDDIPAMLLIEPLSGVVGFPIRTHLDAMAVVTRATPAGSAAGSGSSTSGVGVLLDLYHLASNGVDVPTAIAAVPQPGHVQIADAPGRGAPGTGELPLADFLVLLRQGGYAGSLAFEFLGDADAETPRWCPAFLAAVAGRG